VRQKPAALPRTLRELRRRASLAPLAAPETLASTAHHNCQAGLLHPCRRRRGVWQNHGTLCRRPTRPDASAGATVQISAQIARSPGHPPCAPVTMSKTVAAAKTRKRLPPM
jgi:hypothetical protein